MKHDPPLGGCAVVMYIPGESATLIHAAAAAAARATPAAAEHWAASGEEEEEEEEEAEATLAVWRRPSPDAPGDDGSGGLRRRAGTERVMQDLAGPHAPIQTGFGFGFGCGCGHSGACIMPGLRPRR
jgi:hypothetical protein